MNNYSRRVERLETATNKKCERGCVKCLPASLPMVEERGASVAVPEHACDGNPMSLVQILQEMPR
jgi:hypothetical protein